MSDDPHRHSPRDPACLEVFAMLSEYLDGELEDIDCHHIEEHIADCPPCVEFVRGLRRCISASQEFQGREECPPLPPEMEERLRSAWQSALARRNS